MRSCCLFPGSSPLLLGVLLIGLLNMAPSIWQAPDARLIAAAADAGDGRPFAGFYRVSNVVDTNDDISLTLTVNIVNHSGAPVSAATLVLENPVVPDDCYGTFTGISIEERGSLRVAGDFFVPRHEYENWQQGATPHLRLRLDNADGKRVEHLIELAPMLDEEEGQ